MRALFWLLAIASLAVGLSIAAQYNEGYVLFVLPPWRLELSLNLLVVLLLIGFVAAHLSLRLIAHTLRLPRTVEAWRTRRRRERAMRAFREALQLLFEGRHAKALKRAQAAYGAGETPGLTALVAERAAHAGRDEALEQEWRRRAGAHDADTQLARLMTEIELALDARRFDDALQALDALPEAARRQVAAQRLALRIYQGLGRWNDLLATARLLEKKHFITSEQAASLMQRAHLENLRACGADTAAVNAYWKRLTRAERSDDKLAATAARALLEGGDCAAGQRIIEERLEEHWNPELVALYTECEGGDALARVTQAEKWLKSQPQDAQLLLVLGKLCKKLQLWGKAQSYLEAALAIEASAAAHLELASLFDKLERPEEAARHYRAAAGYAA